MFNTSRAFLESLTTLDLQLIFFDNQYEKGTPYTDPGTFEWSFREEELIWDFKLTINGFEISNLIETLGKHDYKGYLSNNLYKAEEYLNSLISKSEYTTLDRQWLNTILHRLRRLVPNFIPLSSDNLMNHNGMWFIGLSINIENEPNNDIKSNPFITYCISSVLWAQLKILKQVITFIEDFMKMNEPIQIIHKTGDLTRIHLNNLEWTKSDTDLLELIFALYESGAIQTSSKDLTQKEAIQILSSVFGKESIKDVYKKLNAARMRKKEEKGNFLSRLSDELESYYRKQDKKKIQ